MADNTREIVLDTLLAIERGEEFSHKLLKAVLDKYDYLEGRDKAFIKRLTEGTLERQIELDYVLNQFSTVPVRKIKPLIRCLLRMSTYQILYMDSVPDSAACNEACKLAQKRKFQNLKGFVNGVLRNISKQKDNLPMPDADKDFREYLSVKYSMPKWIISLWEQQYGPEQIERLLEGLLAVHPVSIRFRVDSTAQEREKTIQSWTKEGAKVTKSAYLPYVYQVENVEGIASLAGFEEGLFTVQDISSALAVEAAGIKETDTVIDICAAPGGKTMLAAEKAAKVVSGDLSDAKVSIIEENLQRMGFHNVVTRVHDATVQDEALVERGDVVIMDVPCSGLGVMGKKRDIKYRMSPEGMEDIVKLQKQIVENSWQYVKPGGTLLYSTCTIHDRENEEMVHWIAENLPFEPMPLTESIPPLLRKQREELEKASWQSEKLTEEEREACVQLLPGYMDADGFFFATFRRKQK